MSLYQHPRTPEQTVAFKAALEVMGDGYASPMGVTVLQMRRIPAAPAELAGTFNVVGVGAEHGQGRAAVAASHLEEPERRGE